MLALACIVCVIIAHHLYHVLCTLVCSGCQKHLSSLPEWSTVLHHVSHCTDRIGQVRSWGVSEFQYLPIAAGYRQRVQKTWKHSDQCWISVLILAQRNWYCCSCDYSRCILSSAPNCWHHKALYQQGISTVLHTAQLVGQLTATFGSTWPWQNWAK